MSLPSLMKVKAAVKASYLSWFSEGRQPGVYNLIGGAGIGKTEMLQQLAAELRDLNGIDACYVVELYIPGLSDPESAGGVPAPGVAILDGVEVPVLKMHYREELVKAKARGRGGILFIDEIGREGIQLRALMLKLLAEKTLSGFDLSDFYVIVAGNPADDMHGNVDPIGEDVAMNSRLIDIPLKADIDEVVKYFKQFTPTHHAVADYLLDNESMLVGQDGDNNQKGKYRCPRSWFNLAWQLHIHGGGTDTDPGQLNDPITNFICAGTIGGAALAALRGHMSDNRPYSVNDVLSGKFKTNKEGRIPVVQASTVKNIQEHIANKELTNNQVENLVKFLNAIPSDNATAIVRDNSKTLASNKVKLGAKGVYKLFANKVRAAHEAVEHPDEQ